jgi:hypothetical protein
MVSANLFSTLLRGVPVLYNLDYLASVKLTGFQVSYVYELFSTIVNKR